MVDGSFPPCFFFCVSGDGVYFSFLAVFFGIRQSLPRKSFSYFFSRGKTSSRIPGSIYKSAMGTRKGSGSEISSAESLCQPLAPSAVVWEMKAGWGVGSAFVQRDARMVVSR